jgi:hypothetical protein
VEFAIPLVSLAIMLPLVLIAKKDGFGILDQVNANYVKV